MSQKGDGKWSPFKEISVPANSSMEFAFDDDQTGEWVRVAVDNPTVATVHFTYNGEDGREDHPDAIFEGLSSVEDTKSYGGLLYGLGDNRRALGVLAGEWEGNSFSETGYYELDSEMNLVKKEDKETADFIRRKFAIPEDVISVDEASVLIVDDNGRRWRLPKGNSKYTDRIENNSLRICREVATERDLLNVHGSFYELPAENADGYAKIRPVASHNFRIHDYASYRGLLIMTGIGESFSSSEHITQSKDGNAKVWAGTIDDLWKLGKPTGQGGPWKNSQVKAGEPSDPYLIGFYDDRSLKLTNHSDQEVQYTIEVEPIGHGPWMKYKEFALEAGKSFDYEFPESFQSRWIRFVADKYCEATAWLEYE